MTKRTMLLAIRDTHAEREGPCRGVEQRLRQPGRWRASWASRGLVMLAGQLALLAAIAPTSEGTTIVFTGLAESPHNQGLVGNERDPSEMIFDFATRELVPHPLAEQIDGVYTRLTTIDAFDRVTGLEVAPLTTLPAGADAPSGHGLSAIGLTLTDDNPLLLSAQGFELDVSSPDDYFIDFMTFTETRIYRGGTVTLFEDAGIPTAIFTHTDAVATMTLGYDPMLPEVEISVDVELPIGLLRGISRDRIQVDGGTPRGPYAVYDIVEATLTVPTPSSGTLMLSGLMLWLASSRRKTKARDGRSGAIARSRSDLLERLGGRVRQRE